VIGEARRRPLLSVARTPAARPDAIAARHDGGLKMLSELFVKLYVYLQRDRGQTMAEYAIVLALIAIGIVVAIGSLRGSISTALGKVTADI
jgi:Flp pilus assembly pilin Flp